MRVSGAALLPAVALLPLVAMWTPLLDRVIFQPTPGVDLRPAQIGVVGEELFLETEDAVRLHAFYLPAADASRALLFLHGNAGNASHRLPNASELARLGVHVLLLEYRGYGLSEGTPSESGVYADARAGLTHLAQRGFPGTRVVVFGRSLGGAVAIELAVERQVAGLILESTFTSVADVARGLLGPIAPIVAGRRFQSDRKIGRIRCPTLFFHGDRDDVVDFRLGRRLFELAPQPKEFEMLQGAGHNDTTEIGGQAYFARIGRFLDQVTPES